MLTLRQLLTVLGLLLSTLVGTIAQVPAKSEWRFCSPSPTLNSLHGVGWIGSKFVVCGELGTVLTSKDGEQWEQSRITHSAGDMIDLWQLAASDKEVVLASNVSGIVWRSTDGVSWKSHPTGGSRSMIYGLNYSSGKYVALATSGSGRSQTPEFLASADGLTWTSHTLDISGVSLHRAVWTGKQFVAIGLLNSKWEGVKAFFGKSAKIDVPVAAVSIDGRAWTVTELPNSPGHRLAGKAIAWTGSVLVMACGHGEIFTSVDGVSWTLQHTERDVDLTNVVWTGGQLVAVGTDMSRGLHGKAAILMSADGNTWIKKNPADGPAKLSNVTWAANQFVAVGYSGQIQTSKDGDNWSRKAPSGATGSLTKITSNGGKLVAVGNKSVAASTDDGKHWTPSTVPDDFVMDGIAWSGQRFVAVGRGGVVYASPDGTAWKTYNTETKQDLKGIAWTGTQFVCVGIDNTKAPSGALALTSPDGEKWKQCSMPIDAGGLCSVVSTGHLLVAVGHRGTVLTSTDGDKWSLARGGGMLPDLEAIAWSGKRFVAIGRAGAMSGSKAILCSSDGITWTEHPGTGPVLLFGITWAGDRFIAVGERGTVIFSPDGLDWNYDSICTDQMLDDVFWDGKSIYAVGAGGVVITAIPRVR